MMLSAKPAASSLAERRKAKAPAETDHRPALVILCGIPGAGKTTLYNVNYAQTHFHLSLDTIPSRSRTKELELFHAAISRGDSIVVDNTNLTPAHRKRYIPAARAAGYRVTGIELVISINEAMKRIATRERKVPEIAVRARAKEFVSLRIEEGFDLLLPAKT